MKHTLYTVSKCHKDDSLYGPLHGSSDVEFTTCGQNIDENWYIVNNTFDGKITCKKCINILTTCVLINIPK